jgi:nucleotide-binding universal stress UspA family protein
VLDFDASTSADKAASERATETIKADGVDITTRSEKADTLEEAIVAEATKGYGLLVIGREPVTNGNGFDTQLTHSVLSFDGPFAIVVARQHRNDGHAHIEQQNVLVPITGTAVSRDGAELAIALAQASQGTVTALYVTNSGGSSRSWRQQFAASAAIKEIVQAGEHYGIEVRGLVRRGHPTENAILREIGSGRYNLLVMGVSPRPGDQLFFGEVAADVLERARCSICFVSGEHR